MPRNYPWGAVAHEYPLDPEGREFLVVDLADEGYVLEAPDWFEGLEYEEQRRLIAAAYEYLGTGPKYDKQGEPALGGQ